MKTAKRRNLFIKIIVALLFVVFFGADDDVSFAAPVADSLYYIGHASVKIKTSEGKIIYIDPFQPGNYTDSADVVLITHQHSDHNVLNLVKRKSTATVISNVQAIQSGVYQSFTIGNIKVDAVAAYNQNHAKSACVGYVVEMNGIKLYHAGDTGVISEMADLAAREITYALLPIDGIFTITAEQATQAASTINAKFNIPMHTMPPPDTYNEANVANFTPANKIVVRPGETIALTDVASSVEDSPEHPVAFALGKNYPNPFNPSTVISFQLPVDSEATLGIYNINGQLVKQIASGKYASGKYQVVWDATDDHGMRVASGVYLYVLKAGDPSTGSGQGFVAQRKLVLMK